MITVEQMPSVKVLDPRDHAKIWEGFVGTYYAINAPWKIESLLKGEDLRKSVDRHARRYSSPDFREAIYFFFGKNDSPAVYPKAQEYAREFWRKMHEHDHLSVDKISVIVADEPSPPWTVFHGEKVVDGGALERISIIYIGGLPFTSAAGIPTRLFYCEDKAMNDEIWAFCRQLFIKTGHQRVSCETFIGSENERV